VREKSRREKYIFVKEEKSILYSLDAISKPANQIKPSKTKK
jgi:hypothetical protein